MKPFLVVGEFEVFQFFDTLTKREGQSVLDVFDHVAAFPHLEGETWVKVPGGRRHEIQSFGSWLVTNWADGLVREIRVVAILKWRRAAHL